MSADGYERYLEVFDELNRDNPQERRLAVYTLNDYIGAVLAEIGEEYLDFRSSDLDRGTGPQWEKAKSRLNELEDVNIPDRYNTAVKSTHAIRNKIAHDFSEYPPVDVIESSRETVPMWADWILEQAEEYNRQQESLTANEALVQVGRRALEYVRDPPDDYWNVGLSREQESLNENANQLETELEVFEHEDEITRGMVDVIQEILELEREKESLEETLNLRQDEVEREEAFRRAENTYNCIVLEEVNEDGDIFICTNEIAQPDEYHSIDIYHPNTPREVRESLEELESNEHVTLRIEEELNRDSRGYFDATPYIAEIQ